MFQCLKITDGNPYVKKTTDYSIKYSKYMFIYSFKLFRVRCCQCCTQSDIQKDTQKDIHVKQSVSKSLFKSSKKDYWKSAAVIRKKNYNTVPIIDNTRSDATIADLFKDKYATLYNSVSSSSNSMKALHERIQVKITSQCNTYINPSLHTIVYQ